MKATYYLAQLVSLIFLKNESFNWHKLFYSKHGSSFDKITLLFTRRFRPPLSVGNKFIDHFPSVVDGVKFPVETETALFAMSGVSYAGRGNEGDD